MTTDAMFPKKGPAEQGDRWKAANAAKAKLEETKKTINAGGGGIPGKKSMS